MLRERAGWLIRRRCPHEAAVLRERNYLPELLQFKCHAPRLYDSY
jgi:hypothetical protein